MGSHLALIASVVAFGAVAACKASAPSASQVRDDEAAAPESPSPPAGSDGAPANDTKYADVTTTDHNAALSGYTLGTRAMTKSDAISWAGALTPARTAYGSRPGVNFGVGGGDHTYAHNLHQGMYAGSTGAGPCIGVLAVSPSSDGSSVDVRTYHFTATDDPLATFAATGAFPAGTKVALFGGDNSSPSNNTLTRVVSYLAPADANGQRHSRDELTVVGYADSVGLWADAQGQLALMKTDFKGDWAVPAGAAPDNPSGLGSLFQSVFGK